MDKILKPLNPQQRQAVIFNRGPMLVAAGPGSGKTRVLTHKIAYLIKAKKVPPEKILAVTFTNKAAGQMKEQVASLLGRSGPQPVVSTFHSFCARVLRVDGPRIGLSPDFVIYDEADQRALMRRVIKELKIPPRKYSPRAVLSRISRLKNELIPPEEYSLQAEGDFAELVARAYPAYQQALRSAQALDFDDLLTEVVRLFDHHPPALEKYWRRFDYLLVDEYQDTNHAQYAITKLLAGGAIHLCVVGDMSQAIYSFRGADFRNIVNFTDDFPTTQIFSLEENYRSSQTIITAAKELIKFNHSHIPLELWTKNESGEPLQLFAASNERDEANYILENLTETNLDQTAVLYRTNAQSRALEEALIHAEIPYQLVGGVRFYQRREIKDALGYLRVITNPADTVSWERIINTPPRGVGPKRLTQLQAAGFDLNQVEIIAKLPIKRWRNLTEKVSPDQLLRQVLGDAGYFDYWGDGSEESLGRLDNLEELILVAGQFDSLGKLLEHVALVEPHDRPRHQGQKIIGGQRGSLTLMTLHAAKGLEFSTVFITGVEEGLLPHARCLLNPDDLEEERRLFYVGMTRAKRRLHLTYTRRRHGREPRFNLMSRFIGEIPEDLVQLSSADGLQTIELDKSIKDYLENLLG